jgi:ABC-type multidrug transport system fused ATPase/permease subunit
MSIVIQCYTYLTDISDLLGFLYPAIFISIISGGIAPFMTYVIGQVFDSFASFPSVPSAQDKQDLLHGVGIAALELVAVAVGCMVLSSIGSALWIGTGEKNVMRLRLKVFESIVERDMKWFGTKMRHYFHLRRRLKFSIPILSSSQFQHYQRQIPVSFYRHPFHNKSRTICC